MEKHNKNMEQVQKKLNEELKTGSIGIAMKALEKERDALTRVNNACDFIAADINQYVKKFDDVKNEVTMRSKKFETCQLEIESKKL